MFWDMFIICFIDYLLCCWVKENWIYIFNVFGCYSDGGDVVIGVEFYFNKSCECCICVDCGWSGNLYCGSEIVFDV